MARHEMNYLCLAYYDPQATAALPPSEVAAVVKQCGPHDEALRATGQLVLQASLGAPTEARVVKPRHGRNQKFTDGPFTEAKEIVGGFFIIEARDMVEAVKVASLHPAGQVGDTLGWGIEIWPINRLDRYDIQSSPAAPHPPSAS
jgi:hypothetical protein